jgi:hypothetical protein
MGQAGQAPGAKLQQLRLQTRPTTTTLRVYMKLKVYESRLSIAFRSS